MRIAVVGAGIAGLSAARALVDRGHHVKVFERGRVAGGRVATRVIEPIELPRGLSGPVAFDHGAQYFTVRDHRFSELAAELERDRTIARWTGRVVSFDGEGWEDVAEGTQRYVGIPGMNAMAASMASGLDIEYGARVESIEQLLGDAEHAIVAVPADEARALVSAVPILLSASSHIAMKPSWTVMAAFEEPVPSRFDAAFVSGSPLGWIARNTSKPKRNWKIDCWVLQASAAWSQAHADDQSDDVGSFLMEAFEDLIQSGLPRAFHASVHRWRYAQADPPLAIGAIHDAHSRITVCGDWCRGARIEDAWLSGLEAAQLISGDLVIS